MKNRCNDNIEIRNGETSFRGKKLSTMPFSSVCTFLKTAHILKPHLRIIITLLPDSIQQKIVDNR